MRYRHVIGTPMSSKLTNKVLIERQFVNGFIVYSGKKIPTGLKINKIYSVLSLSCCLSIVIHLIDNRPVTITRENLGPKLSLPLVSN